MSKGKYCVDALKEEVYAFIETCNEGGRGVARGRRPLAPSPTCGGIPQGGPDDEGIETGDPAQPGSMIMGWNHEPKQRSGEIA